MIRNNEKTFEVDSVENIDIKSFKVLLDDLDLFANTNVDTILYKNRLYLLFRAGISNEYTQKVEGEIIVGELIDDDYFTTLVPYNDELSMPYQIVDKKIIGDYLIKNSKGQVLKYYEYVNGIEAFDTLYNHIVLGTILVTLVISIIGVILIKVIYKKADYIVNSTIEQLNRIGDDPFREILDDHDIYELNCLAVHINKMNNKLLDHLSVIKRNHAEMLSVLIKSIEAKDPYTKGHSERVALIATFLACDFKQVDQRVLKEAALLHDVGKIGIHENILNKAGRLTDFEYELIKTHTDKGADILSASNELSVIADIVRQHHERFDGRGYPNGLRGAEISLESRILAVADSVDAMISHRPYRRGMNLDTCMAILVDEQDKQFDKSIVHAFLVHHEKIEQALLQFNKELCCK